MKKLNNTVLKILAGRIHDQLNEQAEIAQKESDEIADATNLKDATIAFKQIQKLSPTAKSVLKIKGRYDDLSTLTVQYILNMMRPIQTKITLPNKYHNQDIFDALVIGQIDSADIKSLCNCVKEQFISKTPAP